MYTIICATNRKNNLSQIFAKFYQQILEENQANVKFLSLESLPRDIAFLGQYGEKSEELSAIIKKYIVESKKFVIVAPEYNGSFPGVFKMFIDTTHPDNWKGKKVALVGVSGGRAGNVIGMEHMTSFLNYLKLNILPFKLPISRIETLISDGQISDAETKKLIQVHARSFLDF